MRSSKISLYSEALLFEQLSSNNNFIVKNAAVTADDIVSKVTNFFSSKVTAGDSEGFLNFIAPGAIFTTFSALGMPVIGGVIALATETFKIDISGILSSIYDSIKEIVNSGEQTTSSEVDGIVESAVKSEVKNYKRASLRSDLRYIKLIKIAILNQESINKTAIFGLGRKSSAATKGRFGGILSKVLGFFFKAALASAGFMVAGDIIRSTFNISTPSVTVKKSNQTHFPLNPEYREEQKNQRGQYWGMQISPNEESIKQLLIQFANEVYLGLENKENIIKSSTAFQKLVDIIISYNRSSKGGSITFIPNIYHSKRDLVDSFIDDVVVLDLKGILNLPTAQAPTQTTSLQENVPVQQPAQPAAQQAEKAMPPAPKVSVSYPIVISQKWQERMNPKQRELLSKLNQNEQKQVEEYLESLSVFELMKINNMSEDEKVNMFKNMVREHFGEDAYRRVTS